MRVFNNKLFWCLNISSIACSSAIVCLAIKSNTSKIKEQDQRTINILTDIFKNVNSDFVNNTEWKIEDRYIADKVRDLFSVSTISEKHDAELAIKKIGIDKVKEFWYATCELFYQIVEAHWIKGSPRINTDQSNSELKAAILDFAKLVDNDYVQKNENIVEKNIQRSLNYAFESDKEKILKVLVKLNKNKEIGKLWASMKPLFDAVPTFKYIYHCMWR